MHTFNTLALAAILAAGSLSLPQTASAATALGSNLIVNGDAEADIGSTSGSSIGMVTGFTTTGDFTVIPYGIGGGYPTPTDPGPADRGLNFFGGGYLSPSLGEQVINISDVSTVIDTGLATYELSAYLGGYASQEDNATLSLTFRGVGSTALGSAAIGPVTADDRGSLTGLLFRKSSGFVPVGTRSIVVDLLLTRLQGSSNDGYADDLSLVLTGEAPPPITTAIPEPQTWALLLAGLGVIGLLGRRGRRGHLPG